MDTSGLSGGQIDWLLDHLLCKAVTPLAESSGFLRKLSAELLCQPFSDLRRKISSIKRQKANCHLFVSACSSTPQVQLDNFFAANIERNLLHSAMVTVAEKTDEYRTRVALSALNRVSDPFVESFNQSVGSTSHKLFTSIPEMKFWLREYEKFRNDLIMQFEGLARSQTESIIRNTILAIDYDDMYKNMMLGVQRAIDKYSSHKGTLISYIQMWMRDAHTNPQFSHENGNAFTVSAGERRRITNAINSGQSAVSNLSVEMDEASTVADTETPENLLINDNTGIFISHMLMKLPDAKFAILAMEVPYFLNEDQKKLLEETMSRPRQ